MEQEIWKDVVWYEWLYKVSNLWNVKSLNYGRSWKERLLKKSNNLYWVVILYKDRKRKKLKIHRLIWIAFIPNTENKKNINHIDWNKLNNRVENLEWCTQSENIKHAHDTWLCKKHNFKTNHPFKWKFWKEHYSSKIVYQYSLWWDFIKKWFSIRDVNRELWINISQISWCCNNKKTYKSAWWFIWKYIK